MKLFRISVSGVLLLLLSNTAFAYDSFWGRDGGVNYALQAYNLLKQDCADHAKQEIFRTLKLTSNPTCKTWKDQTRWKLKWYIATDDHTVVLVFRGTHGKENEALNHMGKASNNHPGFEGVYSHEGWAAATMEVLQTIRPYLAQAAAQNKRIMITGHSLGGAMSGYTMFRLLRENYFIRGGNDVLVTSGAPRYAGASVCANPVFALQYASLLKKTGTAAFSVEMWFDPVVYSWTDGNPVLCTANRIGISVNFDPRLENKSKILESVAGNYCSSKSSAVKINFHDHGRYSKIGELMKNKLSKGYALWPGDICVKGIYDQCEHGSCVSTYVPGLSRCAQSTVIPAKEAKVSGCKVVPEPKKYPHKLRHRVEFPECGGVFSADNNCPPYHKCNMTLHCVPKN